MASAGTVNINLVAQTAAFHAAMEKAEGTLQQFGSVVGRVGTIAEAFLGYEAVKKVGEWVKQTMEAVEHQAKLAESLGVSTAALQELAYSSTLAGVGSEALDAALLKMEKNLSGVGGSSANTKAALEAMGLSMKDLQGKSADQQFKIIADGMKNVASSADRAKIAVDLFGKSGAMLLPVMKGGSEGLEEQAREAKALGLTLDEIDVAKITDANESLKKAGAIMDGGLLVVTKELSPLIEGVVNYLVQAAENAGGFGVIAAKAMEYLTYGIGVASDALNVMRLIWDGVKVAVLAVAYTALDLFGDISKVVLRDGLIIEQFGQALMDTGRSISRNWSVVWADVKESASGATQWMGEKFAEMLDTFEKGARLFNQGLGDTIAAAAGSIRTSTGDMVATSHKAGLSMIEDAEYASKKMSDSWSHIGNMDSLKENPLLKWIDDAKAGIQTSAQASAKDFTDSFAKVLNQDGSHAFEDWWHTVQKSSQAHAEQIAADKARQIAAHKAAAAAELAIDTDLAEKIKAGLDKRVVDEDNAFKKHLDLLKKYHDESLLSDAEFKLAEQQATLKHEVILAGISKTEEQKQDEWDKQRDSQKLAAAATMLGNLASLMQSHSKTAFEIGKIAALGQAIVSTAAGIARQFEDLPIYLAIPAAAAVAAAGGVQIASIASQQYGGGASYPSASSGASIGAASAQSAGGPGVSQGAFNTQAAPLQISISGLSDDAIVSGKFVRNLIAQINQGQANGTPIATVGVV